ncbi:MAG: septal ring lytic transglycosylase RlpA family protein [Stellaceae bacterium]
MSFRCAIAFSLAALAVSGGAKADQRPAHAAAKAVVRTAAVTHTMARLASAATVSPASSRRVVRAKVAMATPAPKLAAKRPNENTKKPEAMCVRPIGKVETGTAAWYGGTYIGRRTSSGSRLDTISPTAAHRTLPLNSLARVTNLQNGRSVVVRVTDRGPISTSLLIDMSPKAADELQMKHAGLVPVKVEQVVEVPADLK